MAFLCKKYFVTCLPDRQARTGMGGNPQTKNFFLICYNSITDRQKV